MAKKRYLKTVFQKVLVPVVYGSDCKSALAAASIIAGDGQVILMGLVKVPPGESLSAAAVSVREVRQHLKNFTTLENIRVEERVHASHNPWDELVKYIHDIEPDLLVLEWPRDFNNPQRLGGDPRSTGGGLQISPDALAHPPCDVAIISVPIPEYPKTDLVSMRGGPYAELALQVSLAVARNRKAKVTSLHISAMNAASRLLLKKYLSLQAMV